MRKIHEIRRDLGNVIEEYKGHQAAGRSAEAAGCVERIRALKCELEGAQEVAEAERAAAADRFSDAERRELGRFSFAKFLREAAGGELTGFEQEIAQEGVQEARALGRTLKGLGIPYSVLSAKRVVPGGRRAAAGQSAGVEADGGYLAEAGVPTYVEALRKKLVMQQLGAQFLTGLVGTLSFVKGSAVDIAWAGEAEEVANEKVKFSLQEMKQKRLVVTTAFTKDLLNQTSLDVEGLIMNELVLAHAQGLDSAAINGGGGKAPTGVLNLAGIGSVSIGDNGGAIDWAKVVALETGVESKDALLGRPAYLTTPKVVGALKTTEKAAGTARFLLEVPGTLNGYPVVGTNLVPSVLKKGTGTGLSAMLFGNFNDVVIGQWGGLDVIVDPYTLKKSAQVEVTLNAWHDVYVRHDESFAAIKDIVTA